MLVSEDEDAEVMPAVLSYDFWRRRFGRDPGIVGQDITLNGHRFVIVGVAPKASTA